MGDGSDRSLKMLAAALQKEEEGLAFYRESAAKCKNELGKQIFRALTSDEGVHITRIKEIYGALDRGQGWSAVWKSHKFENRDLQELLRQRAAELGTKVTADTTDLEAVEIGIGMEQGAIAFYLDQQTKATDGIEQEFVTQMVAEERGHLKALEDLKLFLTDPQSWYSEHERHGLDGG